MAKVNPEILIWARETAGLTKEEAARKLGFRDSARSSAEVKLEEMELGQKEPTRPQLLKMAGQYHRPLLTFYLSNPPQQSKRGVDFRNSRKDELSRDEGLLDALVRDIRTRQSMVRAALEEEDEARVLSFIGSHRMEDGRDTVIRSLKSLLNVDTETYRAEPNQSAAFDMLRGRVEGTGVFVLLQGDLGNHLSAFEPETFRGFSIADDVAPFIVINDRDARAAWSFTLLHETVHLLLGQTGVSGEYGESEIERFCDDVAGEFLLPGPELNGLSAIDGSNLNDISESINFLAGRFKVSHTMIAYRAYRSSLIDGDTFTRLLSLFRQAWRESRERSRAVAQEHQGGPNYYTVRRHRLGGLLVSLVRRMMSAEAISTSRAARILGVAPGQVGPLLGQTASL